MLSELSSHDQIFNKSFFNRKGSGIEHIRAVSDYSIIDQQSFEAAELPALHTQLCSLVPKELNSTIANVSLLSSLISPPTRLIEIRARQAAIRELGSNPEVRAHVEAILKVVTSTERDVLKYLSMTGSLLECNGQLRNFKRLEHELRRLSQNAPQIKSDLLSQIFQDISKFSESDPGKIVRGPTLVTLLGLRPKEKAILLPRYNYRYAPFDSLTLTLITALVLGSVAPGFKEANAPDALKGLVHTLKSPEISVQLRLFGAMGIWMWPAMLKRSIDAQFVHIPLIKKLSVNDDLATTLGALGLLGELYNLHCASVLPSPVKTTPVFNDCDRFEFSALQLHNPLVLLRGEGVIPNDFTLADNRLISIEGSNSGGKTFFCKAALQTQMMAQLGADVYAAKYLCSVAEHFFYHIVSSGTLENEDGNFGSGLMRAEQLLYDLGVNRKFFAVLDEIAEGTTQTEKIETAGPILHSFSIIGAGILWANHNHELVSMMPPDVVDAWKIEMDQGVPTHKLVRGISKSSGAKRVVKKHRLDPDSLREELDRRGLEYPDKFIGEGSHCE